MNFKFDSLKKIADSWCEGNLRDRRWVGLNKCSTINLLIIDANIVERCIYSTEENNYLKKLLINTTYCSCSYSSSISSGTHFEWLFNVKNWCLPKWITWEDEGSQVGLLLLNISPDLCPLPNSTFLSRVSSLLNQLLCHILQI